MTTTSARDAGSPIGVADAIASLRAELSDSIAAGADQDLQFEVGEISLELSLEVERDVHGGGGIKFWVVNAEAGASSTKTSTHKLTIPLTPRSDGGGPVLTGRP